MARAICDPPHGQIVCFPLFVDVRLRGGLHPFEGRVEILRDGVLGTVCDDSFDVGDADIVCKQLGYEYGAEARFRLVSECGFSETVTRVDRGCKRTDVPLPMC